MTTNFSLKCHKQSKKHKITCHSGNGNSNNVSLLLKIWTICKWSKATLIWRLKWNMQFKNDFIFRFFVPLFILLLFKSLNVIENWAEVHHVYLFFWRSWKWKIQTRHREWQWMRGKKIVEWLLLLLPPPLLLLAIATPLSCIIPHIYFQISQICTISNDVWDKCVIRAPAPTLLHFSSAHRMHCHLSALVRYSIFPFQLHLQLHIICFVLVFMHLLLGVFYDSY